MNALGDLRLVRLHVEGYGRLHDYLLEAPRTPGILVVAPNEAGKSTICSALFRGLFGFTDKAREELRRPWGGGPFKVSLEWSVGGDLGCAIERDFQRQEVSVEWRRVVPGAPAPVLERRWEGEPNPRGRSNDLTAYEGELRRLLGFASSDLFRQTVYMGPGDPVMPLAHELLRLLSGSDRTDFRAALVEFESHYYDLTQADIRGSGRPVKQKARRIEELTERRSELVAGRDRALAARAARRAAEEALRRTRARIEELARELGERERAESAFRQATELRRAIRTAEARREELDEAIGRFVEWERTVRQKAAELERYVKYLRLPADFPERVFRLQGLDVRRVALREEATRLREAQGAEAGPTALVAATGAGTLLAAGAAYLAVTGWTIPAIGAGALALAVLGGAAWLRRRRRARRRKGFAELERVEAETTALEEELRRATVDLPPNLEVGDPEREIERYRLAHQMRAELDGMQSVRAAMGNREVFERERRAVKEERLDVLRLAQQKLVEAHPYLEYGPDYQRQFAAEQDRLRTEAKRLDQEELAQRRALADLGGPEDDPFRLDAEVAAIDAEMERLTLDKDAYRLAYETLTACKEDFVRVMTQRLQKRIGRVFEAMTGGRYDQVEIDPVSLELTVQGLEKRDVPAESLSRGTRDQLFFALRVAILEELSSDRALPIVLDDPFLHFDRDRLARVEETLARLGDTHQILLFTHDPRLAGWAFPKQFLREPATREEVPASGS